MAYEPAFILGAVHARLLECLFAAPATQPSSAAALQAAPTLVQPRPADESPSAEKLYLPPRPIADAQDEQSLRRLLAQRGFAVLHNAQTPPKQLAQSLQAAREIVGWADTLADCLAWCRPGAAICCLTPAGTAIAPHLPQTAARHRLFLGYVAGTVAPDGSASFDPADLETALDILQLYAMADQEPQA